MTSQASDDTIRHLVWSGFYREAQVLDLMGRSDATHGTGREAPMALAVRQEFERKAGEEARWPEVTDNDRLDQAFDELNRSGVLSVQNAGVNQEDGFDQATQRFREQRDALPAFEGYCFYSRADMAQAIDGDGLLLAFGDLRGEQVRAIEVGQRIVEVLRRHGLAPEWTGAVGQRIEIPGIIWQRRSP